MDKEINWSRSEEIKNTINNTAGVLSATRIAVYLTSQEEKLSELERRHTALFDVTVKHIADELAEKLEYPEEKESFTTKGKIPFTDGNYSLEENKKYSDFIKGGLGSGFVDEQVNFLEHHLSTLEKRLEETTNRVSDLEETLPISMIEKSEHPEEICTRKEHHHCNKIHPEEKEPMCLCGIEPRNHEHPEEKEPTKHINPNSYQGDLYKTPTNANLTQPKEECSHELALGRCINCGKKVQTIMKQENSKLKPQPKEKEPTDTLECEHRDKEEDDECPACKPQPKEDIVAIEIAGGYVALVDAEDYPKVSSHKWNIVHKKGLRLNMPIGLLGKNPKPTN